MAVDYQKENKTYEEAHGTLLSAIRRGIETKEVLEIYDNWASNYDKDTSTLDYNPPDMLVREVEAFCGNEKAIKVLDLASGTGKVGRALHEKGFKNLDAIDGSAAMMEIVKKLNVYTNFYHAIVGSNKLDIADDTYDLIATVGSFCPGHLSEECYEELIRITKKGGHIMILMGNSYFQRKEEFALNMEKRMLELEENGFWKVVTRAVKDNYYEEKQGVLFLLQKCYT